MKTALLVTTSIYLIVVRLAAAAPVELTNTALAVNAARERIS